MFSQAKACVVTEPILGDHMAAVLQLNNAHEEETSALGRDGLAALLRVAFWTGQTGAGADGCLIALAEGADYDSPNYAWFGQRFDRFVYVDRIVVAAYARRRGLAARLYAALFQATRASGRSRVCCEVNRMPPNPGSDRFHARLGFEEIGRSVLVDRAKTVRYLVRPV